MPKSIRLEILDTVIARLESELTNFTITDNHNEAVTSTDENVLWCHLGNTEVSEVQINNVMYSLNTSVTIEGMYRKDSSPTEDFITAKEEKMQLVVEALTQWKYMTDSDANFGDIQVQGANFQEETSKAWETISGLFIGYSVTFTVTHLGIRSIFNSPLDLANLSLWLDLEDSSTLTSQYNLVQNGEEENITVDGTRDNYYLTASEIVDEKIVSGCKIRVNGRDIYIVSEVSEKTISTTESLTSDYEEATLEVLQISEVEDKSNFQTDAIQETSTNQPLLVNDNSAYFVSDQYFTITQSAGNLSFDKGNFTIFFKAKMDAEPATDDATIFSEYSQGVGLKFKNGIPLIYFLAGASESDYSATLANAPTTTNLNNYFTIVNRDTEPALGTEMYVNAQKEEMATPSNISALNSDLATSYDVTIGKLRNGSSSYFTGRFYAMVVCKGILSKLDIERLNKYYSG